jgi:acetyl esterase
MVWDTFRESKGRPVPLDPSAQIINDLVVSARADQVDVFDATTMREGYALLLGAVQPAELRCARRDLEVAGRAAILLTPRVATDRLLVWFHGGGWVIGSPELSLSETDALAVEGGCLVLSLDYRLAPEHPFPAAYDDAVAAVRWAQENADHLGIDPRHIAVGGDSAGGNLAASVSVHFGHALSAQLLVYPAVDLQRHSLAAELYAEGYLLHRAGMDWFKQQYLANDDAGDVRASPMLASDEDLSRVPPAHIVVAEFDPLRDDGFDYARRLAELGVPVTTDYHADQMHGFFSCGAVIPGAQRAIERAGAFLSALR